MKFLVRRITSIALLSTTIVASSWGACAVWSQTVQPTAPASAEELPLPPPLANDLVRQQGLTLIKIQDIANVLGVQSNTAKAISLVSGLNNTGGRSPNTMRARLNVLNREGLQGVTDNGRSTALVMVRAEIPPFARLGEEIQATVAVFDDATDLKGGELIETYLAGPDGEVYAIADGPLIAGGFAVAGAAGSATKNHPTTATVKARIVKEICQNLDPNATELTLFLEAAKKDAITATRIAGAINQVFPGYARASDPGSIQVQIPAAFQGRMMEFVSLINHLDIVPNVPARVVINQKTGTVVMGHNVRISRVMFANDNLIITMNENPEVSQPNPFGQGNTVVVPRTQITAVEQGGNFNVLNEGITVGELAQALNTLGVTPQDLINILQALRAQGSLHAELIEQ